MPSLTIDLNDWEGSLANINVLGRSTVQALQLAQPRQVAASASKRVLLARVVGADLIHGAAFLGSVRRLQHVIELLAAQRDDIDLHDATHQLRRQWRRAEGRDERRELTMGQGACVLHMRLWKRWDHCLPALNGEDMVLDKKVQGLLLQALHRHIRRWRRCRNESGWRSWLPDSCGAMGHRGVRSCLLAQTKIRDRSCQRLQLAVQKCLGAQFVWDLRVVRGQQQIRELFLGFCFVPIPSNASSRGVKQEEVILRWGIISFHQSESIIRSCWVAQNHGSLRP